jgi:hypothetical protein
MFCVDAQVLETRAMLSAVAPAPAIVPPPPDITSQQMQQQMQQTQQMQQQMQTTTTNTTNTTNNTVTVQTNQTTNGSSPAGTWTPLTNVAPDPFGTGTMMLLPDGRVMVEGDNVSNQWFALSPDSKGNYINGTWTTLASMSTQRLYFGSNVLPSGKVFVQGGEYSGPIGAQNITNTGEIYDPATNTWSTIATFPQPQFGDDPTIVLPNGQILAGYIFDGRTFLYDPTANTWTQTVGSKLGGDRSDEETWVMLSNGNILSYDVFANRDGGAASAQMYNFSGPNAGTWTDAGVVPVSLTDIANFGAELGPAALLPDGRVFQIGANGHTAIYTPSTNTWVKGPDVPGLFQADDAPGAMLPNGHFLFAADSPVDQFGIAGIFNAPTKLFDFDPVANTITNVTPGGTLGFTLSQNPAFTDRMLVLPNGHILMSTGVDNQLWDYNPTGAPNNAWRPTITNVSLTGNTFTVTGTQLNGLSQGASYGDDAEMDSNYPIFRLTDQFGNATYAVSSNWTPGVATGSSVVTAQFTLPAGLNASGTYKLDAIANGIASSDFTLNLLGAPQNVTATALNPTTAQVSWSPVVGADLGYQVYMVTGTGNVLVGTASSTQTTAVASGLTMGSVNTLFVRALSSTYVPGQADSIHVQVTTPQGLQAPQNVQVFALSPTTAYVSWNAVVGADLGYAVFMVTGTGNVQVATAPGGTTNATATGLPAGTTVVLFVRALSDNFFPFTADSSTVSVVMPAPLAAPSPTFSNITTTTAVLSWLPVATADGYRVYEMINGQKVLVDSLNSSVTSVLITGLTPGSTTSFLVEAFRGTVVSDSSWVSVITLLAALQSPISNQHPLN